MRAGANAPCHSSKDTTHRTPKKFFEYWQGRIGRFGLDAAASKQNALCKNYIGEKQNALKVCWKNASSTKFIWVNPPYNLCYAFAYKAAEEAYKGLTICMLLPVRAGSDWWRDVIMSHGGAYHCYFLRGRICFRGSKLGAPFDSCVVIFKKHASEQVTFSSLELRRELMGHPPLKR